MLFNITDITNSLAEPHFKATRWVLGEFLKFNTPHWLAFPLKYKAFDKYNTSTTTKKRTLNCRVWVTKINNNILLLNKRKKRKKKNNSGKSQEWESLSSKWRKVRIQFVSRYGPLSFRLWDSMTEPVLEISSLSLGEYSLFLSPLSYQSYSFLP